MDRAVYRQELSRARPADRHLTAALAKALGQVEVLERVPNVFASSFPADAVLCRIQGGAAVRLLSKCTANLVHDTGGHRGGVAYEALVYSTLLDGVEGPPRFYGATETDQGFWLFLEFLEPARRADEVVDPFRMLPRVASWAGGLHQLWEGRHDELKARGAITYEQDYYAQWARRTASFAGPWHAELPWLTSVCDWFQMSGAEELADLPRTLVHGEFTPHNVLVQEDRVRPVDWESAASAPGEIDLASITEQWPAEVVDDCLAAYAGARWAGQEPGDLRRRVDLAGVYWSLRWLGQSSDWSRTERTRKRAAWLHGAAERLGILR
jgi:hypothetical protein